MLSQALEGRHNTAQGVNPVYVIHPHPSSHARACAFRNFSFSSITSITKYINHLIYNELNIKKQ